MNRSLSPLQEKRLSYRPPLPKLLQDIQNVSFRHEEAIWGQAGQRRVCRPLKVGIVFSGGPASGGHNVLAGLFDALKELSSQSRLFGFLNGPSGIIEGKYKELTKETIDPYRNMGGFDLLGSGRTKIETEEQFAAALTVAQKMELDGLVIVGGDDSNTNAALLADYYQTNGCKTCVLGVPKTIDGDLQNDYVAISFGFDTACKTYAELIGNLAKDAASAGKYYHFIKLMGRTASHIALECALYCRPNLVLIGEEQKTLKAIVQEIADLISERAEAKKHYGVILIPEGLVEFIPEVKTLISELNQKTSALSAASKACFDLFPERVQKQLLLDRDPHGNVQVSHIETELLLSELVEKELKNRPAYKGKFNPLHHFFGYEGRSAMPSNFDCCYCEALGRTAALLLDEKVTGHMCFVGNLSHPPASWTIGAVPLSSLIHLETRAGAFKPVIKKALVDLKGKPYLLLQSQKEGWKVHDAYRLPGPIQFFGGDELTNAPPILIQLK